MERRDGTMEKRRAACSSKNRQITLRPTYLCPCLRKKSMRHRLLWLSWCGALAVVLQRSDSMWLVPHHFRLLSRSNVFRFVQVFCTESVIKDKAAPEGLRQSTVCGHPSWNTHAGIAARTRCLVFNVIAGGWEPVACLVPIGGTLGWRGQVSLYCLSNAYLWSLALHRPCESVVPIPQKLGTGVLAYLWPLAKFELVFSDTFDSCFYSQQAKR